MPVGRVNCAADFVSGHFSMFPSVFPPALRFVLLLELEGAARIGTKAFVYLKFRKVRVAEMAFSFQEESQSWGWAFLPLPSP